MILDFTLGMAEVIFSNYYYYCQWVGYRERRGGELDKGTNMTAGDSSGLSVQFIVILPPLEITSIHRYLTSQGQLVHCRVDT